ncbi:MULTISPECIES: sugar kinase [unclassified Gilliamella]|uniref:sugar kinase n=1 Tax=unclassified Gilliamella TaxID=2685620 RepID=UPI00080E4DD2|nr:sugar kinase [Gilliamella apicola]OCG21182.1 ketodeoxygluconokinase [Gilliamella apicola]OCG22023.1 ketodeoxygluconokinase [Gilliamella apicola]
MTVKIAIIGECMIELSIKQNSTNLNFGGDTLNTSVYLSRLLKNNDFSIHYVTGLGIDPFSQEMLQRWQNEKIKINLVQKMPDKMPGIYSIVTDELGERSFYYWRSDAAAKYWLKTNQTDSITQTIAQYEYVYLSGISIAILDAESILKLLELLKRVKANGGKVIFDNNFRPHLWNSLDLARSVYADILSFTDIAFLTLDDEDLLWGELSCEQVIERTKNFGVKEIVIKRSSNSCIIESSEGRFEVPANRVAKYKVIDTTAAGDSFSAGYLAARLTGRDPVRSALQGHLVASAVIQYRGAIIPVDATPKLMD